jgi:hypothetical protein
MCKKLTFFGFVGICLLAVTLWFCYGIGGGLSGSDILAIRRAIRQETAESILKISGESRGTATVLTGRRGKGLDGSGHEFYLNRTDRGWQIVSRSVWMSMLPSACTIRRMCARRHYAL